MVHPLLIDNITGFIEQFMLHATIGYPPEAMWLPLGVILILGATATVDAFTENIPDSIIFLGLMALTGTQGLYISWPFAAHHLLIAFGAGMVIWLINAVGHQIVREDVFRAGDIKWTVLAVACFDLKPVAYAWGFGLAGGLLKSVIVRIASSQQPGAVYLAPFLFPALLGSLYVLRVSLSGVGQEWLN